MKLAHITAPQSDFGGPEGKGDALHAMELALSFEKLNFQKLKELHSIADKNDDAQMADFVEDMLEEQVGCQKGMHLCMAAMTDAASACQAALADADLADANWH